MQGFADNVINVATNKWRVNAKTLLLLEAPIVQPLKELSQFKG